MPELQCNPSFLKIPVFFNSIWSQIADREELFSRSKGAAPRPFGGLDDDAQVGGLGVSSNLSSCAQSIASACTCMPILSGIPVQKLTEHKSDQGRRVNHVCTLLASVIAVILLLANFL